MNQPSIIRVALPIPLRKVFDYFIPSHCNIKDFQLGTRVKVPFQNRELIGLVTEVLRQTEDSLIPLKSASALLDKKPILPQDLWELCLWAAEYYHYPLGEVLFTAFPTLLRQGKEPQIQQEQYWKLTEQGMNCNFQLFKNAPRQQTLMSLLKTHPDGLSAKELRTHTNKTLLKILSDKGFVTSYQKDFVYANVISQSEIALVLNEEQTKAVQCIQSSHDKFNVFLLDGVTGSGKTEVYLQSIQNFLSEQKQILVLVPEIGLTPQTMSRFQQRFKELVVTLHSGLTEKERLNAWLLAKSGKAKIIIGTRSSVFTPFTNLGLIIVDEEHDLSFKQHDTFRYHARDIAIKRAQFLKIPIVLGSATPSLESLYNVKQSRFQHLLLPKRAGSAVLPNYRVLDIRKTHLEEGLAPALIKEIKIHLDSDSQVMLFLNRRGFAPILMCHSCGWVAMCKRCDVRMIYHQSPERLHCHHCDHRRAVPVHCDVCGDNNFYKIGQGTERLELALTKHFPNISVARLDRDTTQKKGALENLLTHISNNTHRILIGTQMLAKGHHFPNVTLVAVVDADNGFFSSDFRAVERMGQLLLQVSGRAGRAERSGEVIIQTRHPDHPLLHQLLRESYQSFAQSLLKEREKAKLPPHFFFALFRAEAYDASHATAFLQQVKRIADGISKRTFQILGPIPAPLARRAGRHRSQLLIQATQRSTLKTILKHILPNIEKFPNQHRVYWSLDVDPVEMI